MDAMFFATHKYENLVIARSHNLWAVSTGGSEATKNKISGNSVNLVPGDLVFFWITKECQLKPEVLTMPAIVTSRPKVGDEFILRDRIWDGEWQCPFRFKPLGRLERMVSKSAYYENLSSKFGNIGADLSLGMPFKRVPMTRQDLSFLLTELVDDNVTYGMVRALLDGKGPQLLKKAA